MKMFGRLEEHKAALYESNSNTTVTLNSNAEVPVIWDWPALTLDDNYYYITPYEWSRIYFTTPGLYKVEYGVNSKQYSNSTRDVVIAGIRKNGSEYADKTISYSYIRNSTEGLGTNDKSCLVKIVNAGDYIELCVKRKYSKGLISVVGGENSIIIQRLRPLVDGDIL